MVAVIDWAKLAANLEADAGDCVFLDGDLENLSHFLQAYYHLPLYLPPFLVGHGAGAPLAYAVLVQAPGNTFAGALTFGFSPATNLRSRSAREAALQLERTATRELRYLPAKKLQNPWVLLQGELDDRVHPRRGPRIHREHAGRGSRRPAEARTRCARRGLPALAAAYDTLVKRTAARLGPLPPAALGNLPVIEVPAAPGTTPTDSFAIIMSGDGGWAGLDKDVAQALSAHGIPVVGLDSLRYFWSPRTPKGWPPTPTG